MCVANCNVVVNAGLQRVWSEKVHTGQRSLCRVTAQAVARAQIDDRSVERSMHLCFVCVLTTCTG